MNNSLLVRVLDRLANLNKQLQPFDDGEIILFAEVSDPCAVDQFHDKEWTPCVGCSCIKHPGNPRMIHQCERLPFCLKPADHGNGIHSQLDHLQRYVPSYRLDLLGHVNDSTAPFAYFL